VSENVGGEGLLASIADLPVAGQAPQAKQQPQDRPAQERKSPAPDLEDACQRITNLPILGAI